MKPRAEFPLLHKRIQPSGSQPSKAATSLKYQSLETGLPEGQDTGTTPVKVKKKPN